MPHFTDYMPSMGPVQSVPHFLNQYFSALPYGQNENEKRCTNIVIVNAHCWTNSLNRHQCSMCPACDIVKVTTLISILVQMGNTVGMDTSLAHITFTMPEKKMAPTKWRTCRTAT